MGKASRKKAERHTPQPWTSFEPVPLNTAVASEGWEECWLNSRYTILLRRVPAPGIEGKVTWLSIKRNDRDAMLGRDWRDLQRIKNTLCGEELEACEIFPAESRLVDTSNQYHLFVLPEGCGFPFGYSQRAVADQGRFGAKQRSFEKGQTPEDTLTDEQVEAYFKERPDRDPRNPANLFPLALGPDTPPDDAFFRQISKGGFEGLRSVLEKHDPKG